MPETKRESLFGWGHYPVKQCLSWRPEKIRDVQNIVYRDEPIIARGLGRSYGDASLQPAGTISTQRLNHFISFDKETGIVTAQAGVTLAELMDLVIPHGWFPYTIPGTRYVTLGGALACNVHGKNHYNTGDFAEHVLSVSLMLANGEMIECTPASNSELFWATAGGMGMTGIIERLTLQLKPIPSSTLSATTYRVDSLEDMIGAFKLYQDNSDYMVGWIDHMAKGGEIGRGVFEAAKHTPLDEGGEPFSAYTPAQTKINVPFFIPGFILNRYSMALYNKWRFKKYSAWRQAEFIGFNNFFHPLDRIGNWNRLYGKRGFFQYQCLFPESPDVVSNMKTFLTAIQRKKLFSFLAVIKYHRESQGYLTFPKRGYSIALDFPNTKLVRSVLPQLDSWVAEHGGRVYLAKDAMLSPELFYAMYGEEAVEWTHMVRHIDPANKFTSLMSERLQWK